MRIDVSGVDAVVVAGWPGTRASFRQRIGRAGRGHGQALAILVAEDDPMDQYLAAHPGQILGAAEAIVLDPENPYVLAGHLCAAAAELPLTDEEAAVWFGRTAVSLLPTLAERGFLRRRPTGWYWVRRERAADLVDIRGGRGEPVAVVEEDTGRMIATVDAAAAPRTVHAGAVYTHQGVDHLVTEWREDEHTAIARRDRPGYTTWALETTDIRITDRDRSTSSGSVTRWFGTVEVSSQVTEFLRRRPGSGEVIGREPLDLPVRTLTTRAVWWEIPQAVLDAAGLEPTSVGGAAHAAEHAAIGLLPLLASCDRWDIGGLSTAHHPDTGMATIIVYDGYPGGAGFAEQGYAVADEWLTHTAELIETCPCSHGCPSCVYSPKCGNGNEPLDKAAAAALLRAMLDAGGIDLAAGTDLRDRRAESTAGP